MRDVTDNVMVDLPGMEQKRGRGRPRKAHAMTNAERQAAFRARRKAEQPADRSVTVTKKVAEVDAYDDCQEQVDALRFELAETVQAHNQVVAQLDEARREKDIAWRVMREQRDKAEELGREVLQLKKRLLQEKSVTPSNGNPVSFDTMLDLIALAAKANTVEQRQKVRETELWVESFVRSLLVSEAQMVAAGEAIHGDRKVVTRQV
ncbi:hypothetical protein LMG10661_03809 [Ralstonia syzygii subsp. syzygii]|nr:hypothetical protein LMG10661_03809 [Ralstonia syzygii subsp. syzygii]